MLHGHDDASSSDPYGANSQANKAYDDGYHSVPPSPALSAPRSPALSAPRSPALLAQDSILPEVRNRFPKEIVDHFAGGGIQVFKAANPHVQDLLHRIAVIYQAVKDFEPNKNDPSRWPVEPDTKNAVLENLENLFHAVRTVGNKGVDVLAQQLEFKLDTTEEQTALVARGVFENLETFTRSLYPSSGTSEVNVLSVLPEPLKRELLTGINAIDASVRETNAALNERRDGLRRTVLNTVGTLLQKSGGWVPELKSAKAVVSAFKNDLDRQLAEIKEQLTKNPVSDQPKILGFLRSWVGRQHSTDENGKITSRLPWWLSQKAAKYFSNPTAPGASAPWYVRWGLVSSDKKIKACYKCLALEKLSAASQELQTKIEEVSRIEADLDKVLLTAPNILNTATNAPTMARRVRDCYWLRHDLADFCNKFENSSVSTDPALQELRDIHHSFMSNEPTSRESVTGTNEELFKLSQEVYPAARREVIDQQSRETFEANETRAGRATPTDSPADPDDKMLDTLSTGEGFNPGAYVLADNQPNQAKRNVSNERILTDLHAAPLFDMREALKEHARTLAAAGQTPKSEALRSEAKELGKQASRDAAAAAREQAKQPALDTKLLSFSDLPNEIQIEVGRIIQGSFTKQAAASKKITASDKVAQAQRDIFFEGLQCIAEVTGILAKGEKLSGQGITKLLASNQGGILKQAAKNPVAAVCMQEYIDQCREKMDVDFEKLPVEKQEFLLVHDVRRALAEYEACTKDYFSEAGAKGQIHDPEMVDLQRELSHIFQDNALNALHFSMMTHLAFVYKNGTSDKKGKPAPKNVAHLKETFETYSKILSHHTVSRLRCTEDPQQANRIYQMQVQLAEKIGVAPNAQASAEASAQGPGSAPSKKSFWQLARNG